MAAAGLVVTGDATSWEEARKAAYTSGTVLASESVDLIDAVSRRTAHPVAARTPLPPWDIAAMDGWAVAGPPPWQVVGAILAGTTAAELTSGQAVRIATGAAVPPGTQAVLPQEAGVEDGTDRVWGVTVAGDNIRRVGEECARGEVLVEAGTILAPIHVALAAAGGLDTVNVVRRPRVQIIVFGDELLEFGAARDGRVRDSLGLLLPGWLRGWGCDVVAAQRIADSAHDHAVALADASRDADVVVTTGGTASGPADFVHRAVAETGGQLIVDGVDCRPGHPMLLAEWTADDRRRWLVGLPGNPHAAIAALMTLAQPLVCALSGQSLSDVEQVCAASRIATRGTETRLVPCRLVDGRAHPCAHIGSGMLRGLAEADGIAVAAGFVDVGDAVGWLPLPATY